MVTYSKENLRVLKAWSLFYYGNQSEQLAQVSQRYLSRNYGSDIPDTVTLPLHVGECQYEETRLLT